MLFCDKLTAEMQDSFKSAASAQSGIAWYGMPKGTDLQQPIDAGYAQFLKVLMCQHFEEWSDDNKHADRQYANKNPFTGINTGLAMFTISYAHLNMIHCGGKYLRKWVPYHFGWIK